MLHGQLQDLVHLLRAPAGVGDAIPLDGHERRVVAQDVVLERGRQDGRSLVADLAQQLAAVQVRHLLPGKGGGERALGRDGLGLHDLGEAAAAHAPAHAHRPRARRVHPRHHHHGLSGAQVRQPRRVHRGGVPGAPVHARLGQDRPIHDREHVLHRGLGVLLQGHVGGRSAAEPRHLIEQRAVGRGPDADGGDGGLGVRGDGLEHLVVVGDLPVAQQHHDPVAPGIDGRGQQAPHGRAHLGAAIGLKPAHLFSGLAHVALGRGSAVAPQRLQLVAEARQLEAVGRVELVERRQHGGSGQLEGLARHRAAPVQHEHQLTRHARGVVRALRRLEHQQGVRPVDQQTDLRRVAGRPPAQHQIGVGPDVVQLRRGVVAVERGVDVVARALDASNGQARVHRHVDVHVHPGVAGGVGLVEGRPIGLPGWDEARRHHQRQHQLPGALFAQHRHQHPQLDRHVRARRDVAHALREHVGPLLLGQGREVPGGDGVGVDQPRRLPVADLALDDAVAHLHAHGVHRPIGRQREGVGRLDGLGPIGVKGLSDHDLGHRAADLDLVGDGLERQAGQTGRVGEREEQQPHGGLGRWSALLK